MRSDQVKLTAVLAIVLASIIALVAYFRPWISVHAEYEMVKAEQGELWDLLANDAPLEEIQQAVQNTGQDVNQITSMGRSLLASAIRNRREDLVLWLLEQGAHIDNVYPSSAPLVVAIESLDPNMVQLLMDMGADPNFALLDKSTPLSIAKERGDQQMIDLLQQYLPE